MKFYSPEEYQLTCEKLFIYYKNLIEPLIPNARVEYIGSSAIPNAISKGDLDIFVGVEAEKFETVVTLLKKLGFTEKSDTLRTDYLCMLESTEVEVEVEDVAVQVVANGSEFECFLVFRDTLCANPNLVKQYNELKLSCINLNSDDYRSIKSEFIEKVLAHS